jgi:hypothetical protein
MPMIMAFITASFPQHASLTPSSRNTRSSLPPVNSCPKWSQAGTLMRSRCQPDALSLHNPVRAKGRKTVSNKQFYIYGIYVDGVVRYIGKGRNGRMHFHVIEARRINSRRARGANTDRTSTKFYRKLAEAMRHGATITEEIMLDGLTNQRAYRIEKQKIEELHKQKRDQLWNTIDERLIGVTWEEFKRKQREESFQRRQAHHAVGGPAGSQAARFRRSLVRAARAEPRLGKG